MDIPISAVRQSSGYKSTVVAIVLSRSAPFPVRGIHRCNCPDEINEPGRVVKRLPTLNWTRLWIHSHVCVCVCVCHFCFDFTLPAYVSPLCLSFSVSFPLFLNVYNARSKVKRSCRNAQEPPHKQTYPLQVIAVEEQCDDTQLLQWFISIHVARPVLRLVWTKICNWMIFFDLLSYPDVNFNVHLKTI